MKKKMALQMIVFCVMILGLFGCEKTSAQKLYDNAVAEEKWLLAASILRDLNPYDVKRNVQEDGIFAYYQAFLAKANKNQLWQILTALDWVRDHAPAHVEEFARKGYTFARESNAYFEAEKFIHLGNLEIDDATHKMLTIRAWLETIFVEEGGETFRDLQRWHPASGYVREAFDYAMGEHNYSAACAFAKYGRLMEAMDHPDACELEQIEKFDFFVKREDFEQALVYARLLGTKLSADKVRWATGKYYEVLMKRGEYQKAYGLALLYYHDGEVAAYEALYRASLDSGHFKVIVRPSGASSASEPFILLE